MLKNWIKEICEILPNKKDRDRFAEQIKAIQESYGWRSSDYDEMDRKFTGIFKEEIDIDKTVLFKNLIFNNMELRMLISGQKILVQLKMATAYINTSDGRCCFINVRYKANYNSNTIYINRADAYIKFS